MENPTHIQDLLKYDKLYFNDGDSPISDLKYDLLKEEAKFKYPDHSYFTEVGSDIDTKNKKIHLPYILGSLNKIKTENELDKWYIEDIFYIISEKLDGVSIYVKYIDKELVQATTRGNGMIGQDITEKAKTFCPIPVNNKGILEVRGEVLLFGDKYIELGKKNRRNCVAGLLNQKGTQNCEFLSIKFYEMIFASKLIENEESSEIIRFERLFSNFESINLPKFKMFEPNKMSIAKLTEILEVWKKNCKNIYDIDGIVITEEKTKRENIYYPKNKIAFKVNEGSTPAKVMGCKWQVSRTGRIKPVLLIKPIDICGVTIKNVTAHNFKYIQDNKIGYGSEIEVIRSGDVIPYITSVKIPKDPKPYCILRCPTCNSKVVMAGVDIQCSNSECDSIILGKISYFFSSMDVEYFSEKTVQSLMEKLNLTSIEDFYNLTFEKMMGLKGFGDKKITKTLSEIKKTLNCNPENLLSAFGIEGIGKENSKNLFKKYTFEELFTIDAESIQNMEGFGEITSNKFVQGIKEYQNLYNFLLGKGLNFEIKIGNETLNDKIFTLTGTGNYGRKEYQKQIEQLGGSVKGMTKSTNFLVTNDINSTSGKMKKAKKLGIEIISYDDLDEMLSM